jgi:5-methylthioadenosine/S-adenosylhomocysteine deaminase
MGSADVLGVQKKIGSLEKGKYADFLVIDPSSLGAVLEDPYANLVLVATPRDIEQIYVGGTLEVEQGKIVRHSLQKVQSEVDDRVLSTGK